MLTPRMERVFSGDIAQSQKASADPPARRASDDCWRECLATGSPPPRIHTTGESSGASSWGKEASEMRPVDLLPLERVGYRGVEQSPSGERTCLGNGAEGPAAVSNP
jgi:hypothetical protein